MGLVSASHDQHIGRIMRKEDEARSTETLRTTELIHSFTSGTNLKAFLLASLLVPFNYCYEIIVYFYLLC